MPDYDFCVSLSITHPTIDPSDISKSLGLKPTRTKKIGEPIVSIKGKILGGLNKESFWGLDLHPEKRLEAKSIFIEDFLSEQNKRFKKHEKYFLTLIESGGYIEYFIGWFGTGSINMSISLTPELLHSIASLHFSVGLCAYPE